MPKTVTARFETEPDAERALAAVAAEVPLRDSAVIGGGLAGQLTLDSLHLSPEERAICEQQLSKGGFLLVAQVATEARGDTVLSLLDGMRGASAGQLSSAPAAGAAPPPLPRESMAEAEFDDVRIAEPPPPAPEASAAPEPAPARQPPAAEPAPPSPEPAAEVVGEERIPLVEEELRIGKREVVRGRARVHSYMTEVPVQEDVELLFEQTNVERRPVNRRLTEEEVAAGGLLQERVVEITEMREEPVVSKEAFVREELVVTKSIHSRVEQISDTVRRTEVEMEGLQSGSPAPAPAGAEAEIPTR